MPSSPNYILSRFPALNLTDRVPWKPRDFMGGGDFSDVYKGHLTSLPAAATDGNEELGRDNKPLVVAIKNFRSFLKDDIIFEKVRP